jgi:hypothetical protein
MEPEYQWMKTDNQMSFGMIFAREKRKMDVMHGEQQQEEDQSQASSGTSEQ